MHLAGVWASVGFVCRKLKEREFTKSSPQNACHLGCTLWSIHFYRECWKKVECVLRLYKMRELYWLLPVGPLLDQAVRPLKASEMDGNALLRYL